MLLKPEKLVGVHPHLVRVIEQAAKDSETDIQVLEGVRTKERQEYLVKTGASKTLDSRHIPGADGFGKAVDVCPVLDTDGDGDKEPSWHWPHYDALAGVVKAAAVKVGIEVEWGGDWKFKDGPHWQLPRKLYP